jgi:hypothetical protein
MYLHARYFDPQLGTFLSPDPIGVAGGLNQYGYGFGNPIRFSDRAGLLADANGCDGGGGAPYMVDGIWYFPSGVGCPGGGGGGGGGGGTWPTAGSPSTGGVYTPPVRPEDPLEEDGGGGTSGGTCTGPNCGQATCRPGDPNCDTTPCKPGDPGCNQPPTCQPGDPACNPPPECKPGDPRCSPKRQPNPNPPPLIRWSTCVQSNLRDGANFVLGLGVAGATFAIGNAPVLGGALTAGEYGGLVAGVHVGVLVGAPNPVAVGISGATLGGGITGAAGIAAAFGAGYAIGTFAYCAF